MKMPYSDLQVPAQSHPKGYGLTIVIPALNEEGAIAAIIERCLAVRPLIQEQAGVTSVDVVVVSDGSTDETVAIASTYSEIELIVFPLNRGYGAAIQAGWQAKPNALLAFIDADGTCDPNHFIPMCRAAIADGFEIVLGSRMGPESEMPAIRRLGNVCYAALLRLLSRQKVGDSASGMRVVRHSALGRLMPLPDGLHFTPAMSARALLDGVTIKEIPMPYRERVGRSKLNVLRDGLRFLSIILSTALYVRPSRILLPLVALMLGGAGLLLAEPIVHYVSAHQVQDWMIYRFSLAGLFVTIASFVLSATYVLEQVISVARAEHQLRVQRRDRWWTELDERWIAGSGLILLAAGTFLAWPAAAQYLGGGHVTVHWSRIMSAMFSVLLAAEAGITLLITQIVRGVVRQQAAWLASAKSAAA